ncbi:MAG: Hpt domain-containing protein, partial [Planctomycetota bacterium]
MSGGSGDLSGFSMMELFQEEVASFGPGLEKGLVGLGADPAAGAGTGIDALMRAAHSLKGAARVVGLDPIVTLAHAMEDCLVAVQRGTIPATPPLVDALLSGNDLLREIGRCPPTEAAAFLEDRASRIEGEAVAIRRLAEGRPGEAVA